MENNNPRLIRRHINIPVFIPHLGCPNQCVFCNQRTISGSMCFNEAEVGDIIESCLATSGGAETEIAFFGGSFTGIERPLMLRLLDKAQSYVDDGRANGIRMSTRPDYIDGEIVEILGRYTVTAVELGVQSMSDAVLSSSRRGHTSRTTENAIKLLKANGFSVVAQMMLGLPRSTVDDELSCAEMVCALNVDAARIYPTLVFAGTELASMTASGAYTPLTIGEAVVRGARVLRILDEHGVPCLRIGLCESENLHTDACIAGPVHPALGELIRSEAWFNAVDEKLEKMSGLSGASLEITCPAGTASQIAGQNRVNKRRLIGKYGIKSIKIIENDALLRYNIRIAKI